MTPSSTHRGQQAEAVAAQFLEQQGYEIIETNFRIRGGEIDIVADEKGVICLVEVRSRRSTLYGHPLETINRKKIKRLIMAANHLVLKRGWSDREIRFDIVAIVYQPQLTIDLVRGAFDATSV